MAGWVPTFPNAKYVFSKTEYEHWRGLAGKESVNASVYQGGVLPVIESGQAEVVDGEGVVGDRLNRMSLMCVESRQGQFASV